MEWKTSQKPVDYETAVGTMERRVADILAGKKPELVWLVEHPPLYTAGTSAKASGLLDKKKFPVYQTGRGGEYTYHGPGQRVAYVMLDLKKRDRQDIKCFVCNLEQWMIATLAEFGVEGFTRKGRVGVWVSCSPLGGEQLRTSAKRAVRSVGGKVTPHGSDFACSSSSPALPQGESNNEAKIGAIGIRVRKWVTFHGISLNVNPDLSHYGGIVPCGIQGYGVTSLEALGIKASMKDVDDILKTHFKTLF